MDPRARGAICQRRRERKRKVGAELTGGQINAQINKYTNNRIAVYLLALHRRRSIVVANWCCFQWRGASLFVVPSSREWPFARGSFAPLTWRDLTCRYRAERSDAFLNYCYRRGHRFLPASRAREAREKRIPVRLTETTPIMMMMPPSPADEDIAQLSAALPPGSSGRLPSPCVSRPLVVGAHVFFVLSFKSNHITKTDSARC